MTKKKQGAEAAPDNTTHDQNFKNLIVDYPRESLQFFAGPESHDIDPAVRIIPIRQEQLKELLRNHHRELDIPLLVEWPDGRRGVLLFAFEEETDPAKFSIHRLVHYCTDLSYMFETDRVVPVVIFLHPGNFRRALELRSDRIVYLGFRYIVCDLGRIPAIEYMNSDNIVARLNLPNMRYPESDRIRVYAQAQEGLAVLEKDPAKRRKYSDYIDYYSNMSQEELEIYKREYLASSQHREEIMGFRQMFVEEGMKIGEQIGEQRGEQRGIRIGEERAERAKLQALRDGLIETIEMGVLLRYGYEGMKLMGRIAQIQDINRLRMIKELLKTTDKLPEFKRRIDE